MIAAARDFAAGAPLCTRPALTTLTGCARKAFFVSPNFGRAAFGTAIVAINRCKSTCYSVVAGVVSTYAKESNKDEAG
ncbi:MAG: hypothetical protein Q8S00_25105 [Deltaproteobacteria bacterium]|nr:hypothetical protein [Deltaproteobacteria bacterium]